jgi:hypothetical protein
MNASSQFDKNEAGFSRRTIARITIAKSLGVENETKLNDSAKRLPSSGTSGWP